jgi:hypothetical protein
LHSLKNRLPPDVNLDGTPLATVILSGLVCVNFAAVADGCDAGVTTRGGVTVADG